MKDVSIQGQSGRWQVGDTGLSKEITPGQFMMVGSQEAARAGYRDGVDGWQKFRVVADGN